MNSQETGLKRNANTHDKYYTKKEVAKTCIESLLLVIDPSSFVNVIEPAAGNGAFSLLLPQYFNKDCIIAFDIAPEHKTILQQDFLTLSKEQIQNFSENKTIIISNVPFGRQSALAKKFIKQSCKFAKVIAFVLPKSFKKESMQTSFDLLWHIVLEKDLPKNSFLVNGKDYDVPCVFQVWQKKDEARQLRCVEDPLGFNFVKKNEPYDLVFRRVGVNAGKCKIEKTINQYIDISIQSHYFIKLDDHLNSTEKENIAQHLNEYEWKFDNHVGPKSIGKKELIPVLNHIIKTFRLTFEDH
jgi:predicted RNA methylase